MDRSAIAAKARRARFPGRKPLDNRKALTGILFVLKTGIPWEELPQELGCGMSCWCRLREWQQAGVWPTLQKLPWIKLPEAHKINRSRGNRDGYGRATTAESER
jgi:transposase